MKYVHLPFWDVSLRLFLHLSVFYPRFKNCKNDKSCFIRFSILIKFEPITYSFPIAFIYKRFNFSYTFWFFLLLDDLMQVLQHIESIYYYFYWWDLLLCFCFFTRIYKWSTTIWIYFMTSMFPTQLHV